MSLKGVWVVGLLLFLVLVFGLFVLEEMPQKRNPDDFKGPNDKRRRKFPSFKSVVQEVMRRKSFQNLQHMLEPMLRRVVQEEVESAIRKHVISFKWSCEEDVFHSESRKLQLKFLSTLSLPVFTGTRIEDEDGSAIKVALIDALSDDVVKNAPESAAKVEIVVLEGDFDSDEGEKWTLEEFRNNVVRERMGKKPLLTGDVYLFLKEGVGSVGEISFTDNSSWTRSRRFRLGARVIGNNDGARIREAKTESFIVRDHRGELYKKHHPPSLSDEVWRLEKIGKDGAFHKRLSLERVKTVKDFLILLNLDPARLRNILGSGMSAKMWDVAVEHARTCVLDERVCLYYSPSSQQGNGVVFNVVGQVTGLYSESQYVTIDKLSETEKLDAQRMVIEAFQHLDVVVSFNDLNSLLGITSPTASSSRAGTPDASKLMIAPNISRLNYEQLDASSPDDLSSLYSMGCMSSIDDFSFHTVDTFDRRCDHSLDIPVQIPDSRLCETNSMTDFHDDEHLQYFDMDLMSTNRSLQTQTGQQDAHNGVAPPKSLGRRRWRVLSSILRWLMRSKVPRGTSKRRSQVQILELG